MTSDESPWGTPPPSYGPPAGGYPPPPPQPPTGPPQGYPSYGGPQGPPPPKTRTGLIVGLAVGAVVLVAAIGTGVVLAARGGGNDTAASDTGSTSATSSVLSPTTASTVTVPPTTVPTVPTTVPTVPPVGAGTVVGDGYQYELPTSPGWTAATDAEVASLGADRLDTGVVLGPALKSSTANILVERGPSDGTTVDALEPTWQGNIESSVHGVAHPFTADLIDGEQADAIRISSTNSAGTRIQQIAYLMVHGGTYYSIALTYPANASASVETALQDVLHSWHWTS